MNAVKIPLVRFANQGLHFYVNSIVTKCLAHLISHRFCFIERCSVKFSRLGVGFPCLKGFILWLFVLVGLLASRAFKLPSKPFSIMILPS